MNNIRSQWRLSVRFGERNETSSMFSWLLRRVAAAEAAREITDVACAYRDGVWLRVYASSPDALRRAQSTIAGIAVPDGVKLDELAEQHGKDGWNRIELPEADLGAAGRCVVAPHQGALPWGAEAEPDRVQLRFELPNHRSCRAFASVLREAGYEVHTRSTYLFLFADDQSSARRLGDRLRRIAPAGAQMFLSSDTWTLIF